ncbi:type 1 glutamine amidotransferase domain-containing protein [Janthinobacterium agaricidamnosum]|uniref:Intracellular protease, PfpI family protein n=1 Tax=Janthinobacterium agaricidamnosum NBRC 102515 = DSM 9628 TaxID=1349767 RepID=W0VEF4_9BURK|nr:type 1 glutamine amidotransferase domain-containing protein [Janthinobacterium agaricidamnosum]CDG85793.1 intracellular protease, PfpI family protein [Janthinobacterium agaricidamnosum NBRC 102515 = DSM 9628]
MNNISIGLNALLGTETSAAIPRISAAEMFNAPENRPLYDLWTQAPTDPKIYNNRRVAVIATDGVEEIELTTVLHFFRSRGATVDLIAPKKPSYPPMFGLQIPAIRETHILTIHYIETAGWIAFDKVLDDAEPEIYDAVVIPGGAWNPDTLRADPKVLAFVRAVAQNEKIVASICHGPWILADAGLLVGRRATAWWAMKNDLTNAGAIFVDEPVVVDGKIISSRAPTDLVAFVNAIGVQLA